MPSFATLFARQQARQEAYLAQYAQSDADLYCEFAAQSWLGRTTKPQIRFPKMNWRQFIIDAYASDVEGLNVSPIFNPPAPQADILVLEQRLKTTLTHDLRELLLETNGFRERMILKDGRSAADLGTFLFTTAEIADITTYYRSSSYPTNINFGEMCFFGTPHVDGIYFATRMCESSIYAWYPSELVFRPIAPNLESFIVQWLSGALSI